MKKSFYKYAFFMFLLVAAGCSSTQSTLYKPSDESEAWKVNVIKKPSVTEEFVCTINDSVVISESFPLFGDNFEKSGKYRGKKVMMNGFRKSTTTTDSNGKTESHDSYQIRVFINDVLIDKFDF